MRPFQIAVHFRFGSVCAPSPVVVDVVHGRERGVLCGKMVRKWPSIDINAVLLAVVFTRR